MRTSTRKPTEWETSKVTHSRGATAEFDRLQSESAKAFQAFQRYRDLPAGERRLTAVSQGLGKCRSLCARWSKEFRWVERAEAWDDHQDQKRRQRMAAERDKIYERQLQHDRIASQALTAPLVALAKLAQTKADAFANVSAAELTRIAAFAARALPEIHKDERKVAGTPEEPRRKERPVTITAAEFTWVQSRCTCGHCWDEHQATAADEKTALGTACDAHGCRCKRFSDADSEL